MYKQACYVTSVQGSKDKFVKLVLSFYLHLDLRNATQVPSTGRNALHVIWESNTVVTMGLFLHFVFYVYL